MMSAVAYTVLAPAGTETRMNAGSNRKAAGSSLVSPTERLHLQAFVCLWFETSSIRPLIRGSRLVRPPRLACHARESLASAVGWRCRSFGPFAHCWFAWRVSHKSCRWRKSNDGQVKCVKPAADWPYSVVTRTSTRSRLDDPTTQCRRSELVRQPPWKAIAAARLLLSTNAGARWGRLRGGGRLALVRSDGLRGGSVSGRPHPVEEREQCPVRGSLSGITVADDVLARRERIAAAGHDRRNARRAAELALRSLRER
jgi:hypothetical protein